MTAPGKDEAVERLAAVIHEAECVAYKHEGRNARCEREAKAILASGVVVPAAEVEIVDLPQGFRDHFGIQGEFVVRSTAEPGGLTCPICHQETVVVTEGSAWRKCRNCEASWDSRRLAARAPAREAETVDASGRPSNERDGACICDYNPSTTDGPQEDCPFHGRPYAYWVERADAQGMAYHGLLERLQALADEMERDARAGGGPHDLYVAARQVRLVYAGRLRALLAVYVATEAGCHAGRDGDCDWKDCPQIRDGEPHASGRHCPLDAAATEGGEG